MIQHRTVVISALLLAALARAATQTKSHSPNSHAGTEKAKSPAKANVAKSRKTFKPKPKANNRPKSNGAGGVIQNDGPSPSERHHYVFEVTVEFTGSDDSGKDWWNAHNNTIELYGSMSIDGKNFWHIERKDAEKHRHKRGDHFQVTPLASSGYLVNGQFVVEKEDFEVRVYLADRDGIGNSDDPIVDMPTQWWHMPYVPVGFVQTYQSQGVANGAAKVMFKLLDK